jgi:hypothetical protein
MPQAIPPASPGSTVARNRSHKGWADEKLLAGIDVAEAELESDTIKLSEVLTENRNRLDLFAAWIPVESTDSRCFSLRYDHYQYFAGAAKEKLPTT